MSDPFLSADDRREVLRVAGREHNLRVFVETGTNDGATALFLINDFDSLHTIELGRVAAKKATAMFADEPKVTVYHGDSAVLLGDILDDLQEPALIWLDAHYSGGSTAQGPKDTPVIEELEAIFANLHAWGLHVVFIDDARLFEGMSHYGEHDWPHVDEVEALAKANGYSFAVVDDIVRLYP